MSELSMMIAPAIASPDLDRGEVLAFLREVRCGRWRLIERSWDRMGRTFAFESHERPRLASQRELEVLALLSRAASLYEAGCVLGLREPTVCNYAMELARHMDARAIDLVAFGPLFERLEGR